MSYRLLPLKQFGPYTVVPDVPPEPVEKIKPWKPRGPFRFFDLPSELRNRIYEYAVGIDRTIDLDPTNHKRVAPLLRLLQTSRRVYEEAYSVFYSRHTVRMFPTHPSFLNSKQPVLMRLPRHYRRALTSIELRLGPGWGKPPKCQVLRQKLGLKDCVSVRCLKVFVEVDPSNAIFKGYRVNDSFYTAFATGLLEGILQQVPSIDEVQFDAYPSVKKRDALMTALLDQADTAGMRITWGPLRGWAQMDDPDVCDLEGLENAITRMKI